MQGSGQIIVLLARLYCAFTTIMIGLRVYFFGPFRFLDYSIRKVSVSGVRINGCDTDYCYGSKATVGMARAGSGWVRLGLGWVRAHKSLAQALSPGFGSGLGLARLGLRICFRNFNSLYFQIDCCNSGYKWFQTLKNIETKSTVDKRLLVFACSLIQPCTSCSFQLQIAPNFAVILVIAI